MTRYIDINEIKFTGAVFEDRDGEIYIKLSDVKQSIEQTPTADVVEVKHGKWVDKYGNKYANHLYVCSVCGKEALCEFYTNELGQIKERQALTVGCPHCLTKMDGERK